MPQSLTLLCPTSTTLRDLAAVCRQRFPGAVKEFEDQNRATVVQISVRDQLSVSISRSTMEEFGAAEYEENDDLVADFRRIVWERTHFWICFSDFDLVRSILAAILETQADPATCWMDTDYGWVIRGDQILEAIRVDPDWDWRHDNLAKVPPTSR